MKRVHLVAKSASILKQLYDHLSPPEQLALRIRYEPPWLTVAKRFWPPGLTFKSFMLQMGWQCHNRQTSKLYQRDVRPLNLSDACRLAKVLGADRATLIEALIVSYGIDQETGIPARYHCRGCGAVGTRIDKCPKCRTRYVRARRQYFSSTTRAGAVSSASWEQEAPTREESA